MGIFVALLLHWAVQLLVLWRPRLRLARRAPQFRHRLSKALLLASGPYLTIDVHSLDVPAGTPYRVISADGRSVLIEVQLPDGTTRQGYTSVAHVRT